LAAETKLVPLVADEPVAPRRAVVPSRLTRVPIVLIAALFAFLLLPRVREHPTLFWSFAGAATALLVWQLALWAIASSGGEPLRAEGVAPVKQHYVQACVQACLYGYWGWYWRPIYEQLPLIVAQLIFVFAFDALFSWSRGRVWRFASGPAPIVLSTNLFIWFRDDWFYLQWGMIVAGLLGKEFIKWQKDGRRTHVLNPSGFGLLVAGALIAEPSTIAAEPRSGAERARSPRGRARTGRQFDFMAASPKQRKEVVSFPNAWRQGTSTHRRSGALPRWAAGTD
jgi:hypothetical protein